LDAKRHGIVNKTSSAFPGDINAREYPRLSASRRDASMRDASWSDRESSLVRSWNREIPSRDRSPFTSALIKTLVKRSC